MAKRERVETTPEQVIYYYSNEAAKNSKSVAYFCCIVIGAVVFISCATLIGSSTKSSTSTYSSTPTLNRNESYVPKFTTEEDNYQRNVSTCENEVCRQIVNDILNSINKSVDPCDNFYDYACQGWQEKNPRPEYMPRWSRSDKLRIKNTKLVIRILEQPAIVSSPQKPLNDAKQFYKNCIDVGNEKNETEQKAAIQLMLKNLDKYGGWPMLYEKGTWDNSSFDWISSAVGLKRQFQSPALLDVRSYQYPHRENLTKQIFIKPPSWSWSSSSTLLKAIDKLVESNKTLEGLKALANVQNLIVNISKVFLDFQGKSDINETYLKEQALNTLLFQILLPSKSESFDELSSKEKLMLGVSGSSTVANTTLNKILFFLHKMLEFRNQLNLRKFILALYENTNIKIRYNEPLVISNIAYFLNTAKFINYMKEEYLANYLHFRMTLLMIPLSGHAKLNNLLNDFQNTLSGTSGKKERKETCAEITQEKFHNAVGQAFVQTKLEYHYLKFEQVKIIFNNVKLSITKLIENSNISYFNKPMLIHETNITRLCLGHPSWMNGSDVSKIQLEYQGLVLNESATFLEQTMAINRWIVDKSYGLLRQQLSKDDYCQWFRFPGNVEAYTNILFNSVYIPIGIMQAPFYNIFMPTALIYGQLGSILGHEIIHGLAGRTWRKLTKGRLTPAATCLVNQYSEFSTPALRKENVTLNGTVTLNENIADNAGLLGAYKAFKESSWLDGKVKKLEDLKEFTDEQLFFLGFAQNWCGTSTMETFRLKLRLKNYDHAPGMFRVLGVLQNSKEFAKAWKCRAGSNMNPFPQDHRKCNFF